jgi:hypothetical protein
MELDTFMLADAATGTPDGKLFIHGGGITRITPPIIPWTQPQLAIVARLRMGPEDWDQEHELQLSLLDPDGALIMPPAPVTVEAPQRPDAAEGEEHYVQLAIGLASPTFAREGLYKVELRLGEKLLRSLPLRVVAVRPEASSAHDRRRARADAT